jgi:DNA replication and repair protein RecF
LSLRRLQVTDFRCLQSAVLDLDPRFTLISGSNASGKTSLLEAIYVLGRGRSFRTRRLEHLIRHDCERFVVFGEIETSDRRIPAGVEGSASGIHAQIAGSKASSLTELAMVLPVQIIDPEIHRLIEEGPSRRRRFLDWGVFQLFHGKQFMHHWQRYHQALKQRNAGLKAGQPQAAVAAWDGDLVHYGELLTEARSGYVALLAKQAEVISRNLLGMELELSYRAGWARDLSFAESLLQSRSHEQASGATLVGPHRADLNIRLNGMAVKDRISRGQQKLLAAALLIAQLKLFPEDAALQPSLLLDDPAAELDDERLAGLIHEVLGHSVQLIVTTLHGEFSAFGTPGQRFGVAVGRVQIVSRGT